MSLEATTGVLAAPVESASTDTFNYKVVRQFAVMTVVWGIVGMAVGVLIAAQLLWPDITYGVSWLSYGRPSAPSSR